MTTPIEKYYAASIMGTLQILGVKLMMYANGKTRKLVGGYKNNLDKNENLCSLHHNSICWFNGVGIRLHTDYWVIIIKNNKVWIYYSIKFSQFITSEYDLETCFGIMYCNEVK